MIVKGWTEQDYKRCAAGGAWICLNGLWRRGLITKTELDEQWEKVKRKALES